MFLKSFVEGVEPADGADEPTIRWAHIDIAGSMEVRLRANNILCVHWETDAMVSQASGSGPYHEKGMTGRPTRYVFRV